MIYHKPINKDKDQYNRWDIEYDMLGFIYMWCFCGTTTF